MVKMYTITAKASVCVAALLQCLHFIYASQVQQASTIDPSFNGPIPNVTVAQGKEAVLPCKVQDLGNFKVGWIQADTQTILTLHDRVITHNPRIHVSHEGQHTWRLHVRQAKETDRGCYMCQINTAKMKKQLGCIDIHVPPDIISDETSKDTTVSEGSDVTLTCRALGHPTPTVVWRREDEAKISRIREGIKEKSQQVIGETLSLKGVTRHQMGAYLCIAKNAVPPAVSKRIMLSVNFEPVVRVVTQLMGAPRGTDVTVECLVEAFPPAFNYWLKNEHEMLLDGKKYKIAEENRNAYKVHMQLKIKDFSKEDEASYTCVSSNSIGKNQESSRLYMMGTDSATGTHNLPYDALTGSSKLGRGRESIPDVDHPLNSVSIVSPPSVCVFILSVFSCAVLIKYVL